MFAIFVIQLRATGKDVMLCIVWVPCDIGGGPGAAAILILELSLVYILTVVKLAKN